MMKWFPKLIQISKSILTSTHPFEQTLIWTPRINLEIKSIWNKNSCGERLWHHDKMMNAMTKPANRIELWLKWMNEHMP